MERRPEQLVEKLLEGYSRSGSYDRDLIVHLTALALSEDPTLAELATRAIFASLVERLADSFEPDAVTLYNRVFAQMIQFCRADSRAVEFDRELNAFGLASEEELVDRSEALRHLPRLPETGNGTDSPRLIIVLSRVTLGADVAITSVILERMKIEFPGSEIVLVGGRKTAELFSGDPRLQFKEVVYQRGGTLMERLLTWIDLVKCIRQLTLGLAEDEYLVVDPDTRLTQLGLLPVTATRSASTVNYLFFPSREYGSGTRQSLAMLTSAWLDESFGVTRDTLPAIALSQAELQKARRLVSRLRGGMWRGAIAMNFGVGHNVLKRVGGGFEASLGKRLRLEGASLILDKGASVEEAVVIDNIVADVMSDLTSHKSDRHVCAIEINDHDLDAHLSAEHFDADIIVWNGRIGMLAALIAQCDLYIGYDSAGQHIAAALGIPCIDIFTGNSSTRMRERWRPTGTAPTRVVVADGRNDDLVEYCSKIATGV